MADSRSEVGIRPSLFCISTYEKGQDFLREAARLGCEVRLLTTEKLAHADWPKEDLAEFLTMPEGLTCEQLLNTVTYLARTRRIDRIVALDEFDLAAAALMREHMRMPGLGESATRFFRDKLAMRAQAKKMGVKVPEFTGVFNHQAVSEWMKRTPGPWLLKPRMNASAIGIKPIANSDELWPMLDQLGDKQSHYLLERFVAGEVFHCEGVSWNGRVLFAQPFRYGRPPMQTMHQGGVFTTRNLALYSPDARGILTIHRQLLKALGMQSGVTHSEFIKSAEDGEFYFLETAARVGGAYIAEACELATGINPWKQWAAIEKALATGDEYVLPPVKRQYVGSVISLARQEEPNLSGYTDKEIVMKLHKPHHAGILLRSKDEKRTKGLLEIYAQRFLEDFCAVMPPPEKPTS
jgi:biotin carboxylase